MSDYTPTTEEVLDAYALFKDKDFEDSSEEFDRWLSEIAAEAWEQGKQAGRWIHKTGPNPHR